MTLYAVVAQGDLGIIVHIYLSDTDVLVLHALTGAYITGHRTQGKLKPTYFKMFLKAPDDVVALRLVRNRQTRCYLAAMNSSCFQPYCCDGDAGKMAPVQTTEA